MTGWLEFAYEVASPPNSFALNEIDDATLMRLEIQPHRTFVNMAVQDAAWVALRDRKGLKDIEINNLFEFDGDQSEFDAWMAKHDRSISYWWIERLALAFADDAAKADFDAALGNRAALVCSFGKYIQMRYDEIICETSAAAKIWNQTKKTCDALRKLRSKQQTEKDAMDAARALPAGAERTRRMKAATRRDADARQAYGQAVSGANARVSSVLAGVS